MAANLKSSLQIDCFTWLEHGGVNFGYQQCIFHACQMEGVSWPGSVSLRRLALLPTSNSLNKLSKGTAGFSPLNEF